MLNFIYICIAVFVFSFVALPVANDISDEYRLLKKDTSLANVSSVEKNSSLSFDEIYSLADQGNQERMINPAFLNQIIPAAGKTILFGEQDDFSNSFEAKQHPAL